MKRKLASDILERLATDPHDSVRWQVARHRRTPRSVSERLLADDWSGVWGAARGRIENDA